MIQLKDLFLVMILFWACSATTLMANGKTPGEWQPAYRISWEISSLKAKNHVVVRNKELIFEALSEHSQSEDLQRVSILEQPQMGMLRLGTDFALVYTPDQDICEEVDAFSYIIERDNQTDTIEVSVEILCESLTIYSGFSPNDDGVNDTFIIKGIENYPNNSLAIFDYAGREVFFEENYKNDWRGDTTTGEPLSSDYTYYYVFHDGKGNYHSGYLKLDY
ncbi:MAG: gliding motility-associated C-terminal domain-containing protein [Bacteroidota bacterium]